MASPSHSSNEHHDFYISSGPITQRSNSITSFNSFNSTSNMSTMSTASYTVPRGNSTNDLLFMESRFTRPSRPKNTQLKQAGLARPSLPALTSVSSGHGLLPRSASVPSIREHGQQAGVESALRSPQSSQDRYFLPALHSFNGIRSSSSMNPIPSHRRSSLKTQPYHTTVSNIQQSNGPNHQLHSHSQQRRQSNRPDLHNAPFTFPNGEVYTPRNKQRASQTSLKNLHQLQSSKSLQPGLSPSSSNSIMLPHQQPFSFSVSHSGSRVRIPPSQPQIQPHIAPNARTLSHHHQQQSQVSIPSDSQDLSLLTIGCNSYSSSPSPSRTSRTNSSVNESTPPSSIDDLTIHTTTPKLELQQSVLALQNLDVSTSNNLDKIEEHADHEHRTNVSTPASDDTEKTLEAHETDVNLAIEHSSKEVIGLNDQSVDQKEPESESLKPVDESVYQNKPSPPPPPPISERNPAPEPINQPLPQTQVKSNHAKPSTVKSPIISHKLSLRSITRVRSNSVNRKPSFLKRMFKKVFSSSDKKRKSFNGNVENVSVITPHFKSPVQEQKSTPKPQAQAPSVAILSPRESSEQVHQPLVPEAVDTSDAFSFREGDEDAGLKVESDSSSDLKPRDSDDSFKSELVLDKLFSKLSTNEPAEVVFNRLTGEKIVKKDKEEDGVAKNTTSVEKVQEKEGYSDEDDVIQFDDIELVDKMIEYGETPFPNFAAPDLGHSQRKLQRSKSIERKKSLRSISSSSRQLDEVLSEATSNPVDFKRPEYEVIYSNEPRDPFPSIQSRPSILKRESMISSKPSSKKVGFTNQIFINSTYPSYIYNRHSRSLSSYSLSPQIIQQIRYELNDFKRSMIIHESSRGNTHFFHA